MAEIIPAILTNDPAELKEKLQALAGLTRWVQIDIMDGLFVPQTSVPVAALAAIKHSFNLDIHLMVNAPERYLLDCKTVGARRVFFQLEGTQTPEETIEAMDQHGFEKGIALKPETAITSLKPYLSQINAVLLLSVEPGKQGQAFIPATLEKIKALRKLSPAIKIEIDGGINHDNIASLVAAGADYLAVGNAIVNQPDMAQAIAILAAKL